MVSIEALVRTANAWGEVWSGVMLRNSLDAAVLLAALLVTWAPFRRRMSGQLTIGMFSLVLLKLALPMPPALAMPWASIWPSSHLRSGEARQVIGAVDPPAADGRNRSPERGVDGIGPLSAVVPPTQADSPLGEAGHRAGSPERTLRPAPPAARPARGDDPVTLGLPAGLMLAWIAVVASLSSRLIRNNVLLSRRLRGARPVERASLPVDWGHLRRLAGIRREVPLLESEHVSAPAVWGLRHPRVIVPRGLVGRLPVQPLAWVLLHELTHIRRHDLWADLFQRIVQILYFFHPAAWIACRIIRVHREYACDDAALLACRGAPRRECGLGLLAVAERAMEQAPGAQASPGLGLFGPKRALRERVERILDTRRVLASRLSPGATLLLVVVAILTLPYVRGQDKAVDRLAKPAQPGTSPASQSRPQPEGAAGAVPQSPGTAAAPVPGKAGGRRSMELRVINARTRQPEPGVEIRSGPLRTGVTDRDGRLTIAGEAQEFANLAVYLQKPGFVGLQVVWDNASSEIPVEVPRRHTVEIEPGTTIGGLVKDERGRPISGATVSVSIHSRGSARAGEPRVHQPGTLCSTDASGRWHYDLTPAQLDGVSLRVWHPQFAATGLLSFRSKAERGIAELRALSHVLVLTEGLSIAGRVLDRAGRPVDRAEVVTQNGNSAATDVRGAFRLAHVLLGPHVLTVKAKGHAPSAERVVAAGGMPPVEFRLGAGRTFTGRILDRANRPVPGARVWMEYFLRSRSGDSPVANPVHHTPTVSDEEGRFRLEDLPESPVTLHVVKSEGDRTLQLRQIPISPRETGMTIVLERQRLRIVGTVTDAETGRPIPSFNVVLRGPILGRHRARDGRFEENIDRPQFQSIMPLQIGVEAPGYAPSGLRDVPIDKDKEESTLDIRLRRSPDISGVVLAPDGTPAAGAEVELGNPAVGLDLGYGRVGDGGIHPIGKTDGGGYFRFPPPDGPFAIVVAHPLGYAAPAPDELAGWREKPIELTLRRWGRLEGVSMIRGKPRRGETITLANVHAGLARTPMITSYDSAITDAEGRFSFPRVPAGFLTVQQSTKVGETIRSRSHPLGAFEVKEGETARVVVGGTGRPVVGRVTVPPELEPKWGSDGASRRGRIFLDRRPPVPYEKMTRDDQARWDLEEQRTSRWYGLSPGLDGSFRAEDVPPGTYALEVNLDETYRVPGYQGPIPLGSLRTTITVPEVPGGRSYTDEPLDLGPLPLEPIRRVKAGEVAPDFRATTFEGKPLSLVGLRGKYILLVAFRYSTASNPDEGAYLRALSDAFGKDDRFLILGLCPARSAGEPMPVELRDRRPWLWATMNDEDLEALRKLYGVYTPSSILLLGPDGKVMARDLQGPAIEEAVGLALRRGK